MARGNQGEGKAPIIILADDDRNAADRIAERLRSDPDWYYLVPVSNPQQVPSFAKRLEASAILLAEPMEYPNGGAAALLQRLIDEMGKPIIILSEDWTRELADHWKRLGAEDCLPHPSRHDLRFEKLRSKLQSLILDTPSSQKGPAPEGG